MHRRVLPVPLLAALAACAPTAHPVSGPPEALGAATFEPARFAFASRRGEGVVLVDPGSATFHLDRVGEHRGRVTVVMRGGPFAADACTAVTRARRVVDTVLAWPDALGSDVDLHVHLDLPSLPESVRPQEDDDAGPGVPTGGPGLPPLPPDATSKPGEDGVEEVCFSTPALLGSFDSSLANRVDTSPKRPKPPERTVRTEQTTYTDDGTRTRSTGRIGDDTWTRTDVREGDGDVSTTYTVTGADGKTKHRHSAWTEGGDRFEQTFDRAPDGSTTQVTKGRVKGDDGQVHTYEKTVTLRPDGTGGTWETRVTKIDGQTTRRWEASLNENGATYRWIETDGQGNVVSEYPPPDTGEGEGEGPPEYDRLDVPSEDAPYTGEVCIPLVMIDQAIRWNLLGEAVSYPSPIDDGSGGGIDGGADIAPICPPQGAPTGPVRADWLKPRPGDGITDPPRE